MFIIFCYDILVVTLFMLVVNSLVVGVIFPLVTNGPASAILIFLDIVIYDTSVTVVKSSISITISVA